MDEYACIQVMMEKIFTVKKKKKKEKGRKLTLKTAIYMNKKGMSR